ncbi:MAG: hypothetical protein LBN27_04145, partial [Prevotellaceae bacterium]|nr:hypothetical protein [Prevotellaceae bacterium]
MKHQNQRNWFRGIKCMLLTLLCLGAFAQVQAQATLPRIDWLSQPTQYPAPITALGDSGYVSINFQLLDRDMAKGTLTIELPQGIEFVGTTAATVVSNQPGQTTGSPYTLAVSGAGNILSPRKAVITFTDTLRQNEKVDLRINIYAKCDVDPIVPGNFKIYVEGLPLPLGSNPFMTVDNPEGLMPLSVQKPTARIYTDAANEIVNFPLIGEYKPMKLFIDAQQGTIKSVIVRLAFNGSIVTLRNFRLNNVAIPAANITQTGAGTATQVTAIKLTTAQFGGELDNLARAITFEAASRLGCDRTIIPSIQFDATRNCETATMDPLIMQLPTDISTPSFLHSATYSATGKVGQLVSKLRPYSDAWENAGAGTDNKNNNANYLCWNDNAPQYVHYAFTNNNNVPTARFSFRTVLNIPAGLTPLKSMYIDTTDVWYRVVDAAGVEIYPEKRITGKDITMLGRFLPTDQTITSALQGKLYQAEIKIITDYNTNVIPSNATIQVRYAVYINPAYHKLSARQQANSWETNYSNISVGYNTINAYNRCDVVWNYTNASSYNYRTLMILPRFVSAAITEHMYVGVPDTIQYSFTTGNNNTIATDNPTLDPTGARYTQIFVQLPSWMELDPAEGGIVDAIRIGNTRGTDPIDHGNKLYSVKYYTNTTGTL